jgi:deoxyribodipyrimidine photolyase-like uncharacterized protein
MKPESPEEIYLFYYDSDTVWCDTDESEDKHGVKYVRADTLNEIKAQAIEETIIEITKLVSESGMSTHRTPYHTHHLVLKFVAELRQYANKLRGEE